MSNKFFVTKFEVPKEFLADLHEIERNATLDDLAELLGNLEGRRVVSVIFSD